MSNTTKTAARKATKAITPKPEKEGETILRQVDYPVKTYGAVEDLVTAENKRLQHFSRKSRMHIKDILPILTAEGLKFRKGMIYTPEDKVVEFAKDEKWVKLRAKAEMAIDDFMKYQNDLLAKDVVAD